MRSSFLRLLCGALLAGCSAWPWPVIAADTPATGAAVAGTAAEVSIPFAHTAIQNWTVVDNQTVLIQTTGNRWYKARLMSPCTDLPFIEQVGFEANPDGSFDKFSTIRARGQTCQVVSLTKTDAPAKKGGKPHAEPPKPAG